VARRRVVRGACLGGSPPERDRWRVAAGEVDPARGLDTYLLVANTATTPADVIFTLFFEDRPPHAKTFAGITPRSRFAGSVLNAFPDAAGRRFGAMVESRGAPAAPIFVEWAINWDANGRAWAAGASALATSSDTRRRVGRHQASGDLVVSDGRYLHPSSGLSGPDFRTRSPEASG